MQNSTVFIVQSRPKAWVVPAFSISRAACGTCNASCQRCCAASWKTSLQRRMRTWNPFGQRCMRS